MTTDNPASSATALSATLTALGERIDGEVDASDRTRRLYSTDASIYQVEPAGVVAPESRADVQAVVNFARERNVSVVARGAGSSLTGNAVGEGLVVDTSRYLDNVLAVDPEGQSVRVQPGVVLDDLNDFLAQHGLYSPCDADKLEKLCLEGSSDSILSVLFCRHNSAHAK